MGKGLVEVSALQPESPRKMIRVLHPPSYPIEREYILKTVLRDFLGLEYRAETMDRQDVCLVFDEDPFQRQLLLPDTLFQIPSDRWLTSTVLPPQPCLVWDTALHLIDSLCVQAELPILFGELLSNGSFYSHSPDQIHLGLDVFGSSFFMLSRYEEVVKKTRDAIGRFPHQASIASQEGFLQRPIVNEYIELFWWCIQRLWPRLDRKRREFKVVLGHDVDVPLIAGGAAWWEIARGMAGDFLKRRDLSMAAGRLRSLIENRRGNLDADLWNTFGFLLETSERLSLPSTFFFISGHTGGKVDGTYSLEDPWIRRLLQEIGQRGHQIGLHPSYNTFLDQNLLGKEFRMLQETAEAVGLQQAKWGGRQHFLRWRAPTTWQLYEDVGLAYDATLTYPDRPGFRSGICDPYPVFNLQTRQPLELIEQPLIVMDEALLGKGPYSLNAVKDSVIALRDRCKRVNGVFSLLWHNGWLISKKARTLYLELLEA